MVKTIRDMDLNVAFVDFERKLDAKFEARLEDLRRELGRGLEGGERLRETGEEGVFEGAEAEVRQLKDEVARSQAELEELTDRLFRLEERINAKEREEDFWSEEDKEGL